MGEFKAVNKIKDADPGNVLYYISFTLIWFSSFFGTTTFLGVVNFGILREILRVIAIILIAVKCIRYDKYEFRQILFILIIIALGLIVYFHSERGAILDLVIIIVGCKGIELKRLVKWFFFIGLVCLLITMMCSLTGVIEDFISYRPGSDVPRHAFGINYTTDFAAFVFFLILAYHYFREHKIKIWDVIVHLAIVLFLDRFCDARLSEIMIILTLVMFLFYDYRKAIFQRKYFKWITILSTVIAGVFSVAITYAYSSSSAFWVTVDNVIFSRRLYIGRRVMDNYGFSLFGQYFTMRGKGYFSQQMDESLGRTFLDSSYVQILIVYGIVTFIVLMIFYTASSKQVWESGDLKLAIVIVVLAVDCIWNQYLINVAFNPFIVMIGIYLLQSLRRGEGIHRRHDPPKVDMVKGGD